MKVVIQCAASKMSEAGYLRTADGRRVVFVAHPEAAPQSCDIVYARPDDVAENGETWRTKLLAYNGTELNNHGLLPAFRLYQRATYRGLAERFGRKNLFILSAGWGLITADFLTPAYDITFSASASLYKRRRTRDAFEDICQLDMSGPSDLVFLGGKAYLEMFCRLTEDYAGRRVVFFNNATTPEAPGCNLVPYRTTTRTNWYYECADSLIAGRIEVPGCD